MHQLRAKPLVMLSIVFVIISILYTVSPIDLVPDVIPVLGWLDDLLAWGVTALVSGVATLRTLVEASAKNKVPYEPIDADFLRNL